MNTHRMHTSTTTCEKPGRCNVFLGMCPTCAERHEPSIGDVPPTGVSAAEATRIAAEYEPLPVRSMSPVTFETYVDLVAEYGHAMTAETTVSKVGEAIRAMLDDNDVIEGYSDHEVNILIGVAVCSFLNVPYHR